MAGPRHCDRERPGRVIPRATSRYYQLGVAAAGAAIEYTVTRDGVDPRAQSIHLNITQGTLAAPRHVGGARESLTHKPRTQTLSIGDTPARAAQMMGSVEESIAREYSARSSRWTRSGHTFGRRRSHVLLLVVFWTGHLDGRRATRHGHRPTTRPEADGPEYIIGRCCRFSTRKKELTWPFRAAHRL